MTYMVMRMCFISLSQIGNIAKEITPISNHPLNLQHSHWGKYIVNITSVKYPQHPIDFLPAKQAVFLNLKDTAITIYKMTTRN
jgi:hypothetical protein